MTKDELLNKLLHQVGSMTGVQSASKIDGEYAIGVETKEGELYLLTLEDA